MNTKTSSRENQGQINYHHLRRQHEYASFEGSSSPSSSQRILLLLLFGFFFFVPFFITVLNGICIPFNFGLRLSGSPTEPTATSGKYNP
jgi:hypothetical protein